MTGLWTLDDLRRDTLEGTRVFVRVDFNVPLSASREVTDTTRIEESLPTLRELSAAGARLVLASHCGRPKGKVDPRYSLRPVAAKLAELLGRGIAFSAESTGEKAQRTVASLSPGGLCLLENLRFDPGEEACAEAFSARLAELADAYVNDAFGTAHRAHASTVGMVAHFSRKAAGRLLVREVEALGRLLGAPERPFAAVLGGAKIGGKIDTLKNLLPRLDSLLLGGGMANTFLVARGADLGSSLYEEDRLDVAREILAAAEKAGIEVILPRDLVVTSDLESAAGVETVGVEGVPAGSRAVDVGPATRDAFGAALARARTLFWNGPLGVFERPPFDVGTRDLAAKLAGSRGFTVIGGGETVAAARQAGVIDRLGHVSTGGGASLEFLAGKTLPGVAALEKGGC